MFRFSQITPMKYYLTSIATIHTDFPTKFGVPRQSGLVRGLRGRIVFEPMYRDPEALRGLEGFSHIWLLWDFSESRASNSKFRATVRPPRLGGNKRMGVFATRSPFRPNNIGLSSVRILSVDLYTPDGPVIEVEGIDMMDGTPIFDIKPYLPFTDCHPEATGGFAEEQAIRPAFLGNAIHLSDDLVESFDATHLDALKEILAADPRPRYHEDSLRIYTLEFAGREIKFRFADDQISAWTEQ